MIKYRKIEIGKYYRSKNPDGTYIYFKVIRSTNWGMMIEVLKDNDTIKARRFIKGSRPILSHNDSPVLQVSRCSKSLSKEKLLAVML